MRAVFRRRAKRDLLDAASWYEDRRVGLGGEFLRDVDASVARILENPRQFPIYDDPARRVLLNRFPYAVYYRAEPRIVVLRVLHLRRHPDSWKRSGAG